MILSFFAGVFIALAAQGSSFAAANLLANKDTLGLGKLVQGLTFTPGLIFVILAGAELFTGNCLMITAVLDKKVRLKEMLKSWILVYLGNFIGCIFVAFLLSFSGQWLLGDGLVGIRTILIAKSKIDLSFGEAFVLGILANFWFVLEFGCLLEQNLMVQRRYQHFSRLQSLFFLVLSIALPICIIYQQGFWLKIFQILEQKQDLMRRH